MEKSVLIQQPRQPRQTLDQRDSQKPRAPSDPAYRIRVPNGIIYLSSSQRHKQIKDQGEHPVLWTIRRISQLHPQLRQQEQKV